MNRSQAKHLLMNWIVGIAVSSSVSCSNDPDQLYYELKQSRGFSQAELLGEDLYLRYCSGCHGTQGNGKGPASPFLDPKPRDFTRGAYKFRTTPFSSLPTDGDLLRTLSEGVYGTSMPPWRHLPQQQLHALLTYLKTFSPRFAAETPAAAMPLPGPPEFVGSDESAQRGRRVYESLQCGKCHGDSGRGDGPSSTTLQDSFGDPIIPFDFTRTSPKGGVRPEDLYRDFMTGLTGTPMPSFADSIPDEQDRWDLVSFILMLRATAKAGS